VKSDDGKEVQRFPLEEGKYSIKRYQFKIPGKKGRGILDITLETKNGARLAALVDPEDMSVLTSDIRASIGVTKIPLESIEEVLAASESMKSNVRKQIEAKSSKAKKLPWDHIQIGVVLGDYRLSIHPSSQQFTVSMPPPKGVEGPHGRFSVNTRTGQLVESHRDVGPNMMREVLYAETRLERALGGMKAACHIFAGSNGPDLDKYKFDDLKSLSEDLDTLSLLLQQQFGIETGLPPIRYGYRKAYEDRRVADTAEAVWNERIAQLQPGSSGVEDRESELRQRAEITMAELRTKLHTLINDKSPVGLVWSYHQGLSYHQGPSTHQGLMPDWGLNALPRLGNDIHDVVNGSSS
jgi:hypothetical protein